MKPSADNLGKKRIEQYRPVGKPADFSLPLAIKGELEHNTIDIVCAFCAGKWGRNMKKKKILFVATVVKTHIMQFHIPYLKMLQQMGWETAVAARNDYENPEDCRIPHCDHYEDIPFERMPWKLGNIRAYRMLKELIRRENYDVIHCHTPVGAMIARLAAADARKKGTKVVYTAHGFHFFNGAPRINWLLFYPAEWLLAPLTDVLITINQEDYLRAKKKLRAKKLFMSRVWVWLRRNLSIMRWTRRKNADSWDSDRRISWC